MKVPTYIRFSLLMAALVMVSACSTKKNTFTRRNYHNLTAHYNAFFNGKESLKEGVSMIEKAHLDDYGKVLPVYRLGKDEDAKSVYPQMDRSIQKAGIVIQRHSIFIKNKEYVKWIDDSYLMMGKANYYKREYYTANEVFQFITKQYKDSPLRFEAMVWMARTFLQLGKMSDAQSIFDLLGDNKNKNKIPEYVKREMYATQAEFFIRNKNSFQAIEPLQLALKLTHKRGQKARYGYILGQLNERSDDNKKAIEYYQYCLRHNPAYVMAFNCKINLARLMDAGQNGLKDIRKKLLKMLKDKKNLEYRDQIYYALAEIAFKEKMEPKAIGYLKLSAATSVSNPNQKATSCLKLADWYFEELVYDTAQAYYDSAVNFLPKDFPNYEFIVKKKNTLTDLVKNRQTIALEDSLQRLSKMTPAQREAVVNAIIKKVIDDENAKKQQELLMQQNMLNNPTINLTVGGNSQWYFYNSQALGFGLTEFIKKWGNRKLEDNWRRINKETVLEFTDPENVEEVDSAKNDSIKNAPKLTNKDKEYYLKNIPTTEEQIQKSTERILEAHYALGLIYRDQLNDYRSSNEVLEAMLKRFPDCKYELSAYYYLYKNYELLEEKVKSDYYKNLILTKYPDSDYANIIKNPNYTNKGSDFNEKVSKLYSETYSIFLAGDYEKVRVNKKLADSLYPGNEYGPQFSYLNTLAIGKTKSKDQFEKSLQSLVKKYQGHPVAGMAQELLNLLNAGNLGKSSAIAKDTAKVKPKYTFSEDAFHLFVLVVPILNADINKVKIAISDFNAKYFSNTPLQINNLYLNDKFQMITVVKFENSAKSLDYMKTLMMNKIILDKLIKNSQYQQFVISTENYVTFYKEKNVEEYLNFFTKSYK
ncbi:MAG: tetratricopeptide repeat protein [Bacteroidota bacterium]